MTNRIKNNFFERHWFSVILITTVFTHLPFLWSGYGADADAWLIAKSASILWSTGHYQESRLPGYPLHEIISAPLVGLGGAPLSNAATLTITLIGTIVWNKIVSRAGQHKKMLVVAFAFAPIVWQHSADTLDYVWSLLFILLSFYAILNRYILLAGVVLGISAGFRPSNLAAIIPFLCLIYLITNNIKQIIIFILSVSTVAVCAFVPLMIKYGIPGWLIATQQEMSDVTHPQLAMRFIAFFYRTIYFIGPLAALTTIYIFWKRRQEIVASIRTKDPIVVTSILCIITFLLLFLWLPLERTYVQSILHGNFFLLAPSIL